MAELLASFTKDSYLALDSAKNIAKQYKQTIITPYQLLLGVLDPPGSLGETVLRQFPFRMDQLITRLSASIRLDAAEDETWVGLGYQDRRYTLSSETTAIIEAAHQEALEQGVDFVDSRTLIMGMLRKPQTSAGEILHQFGITPQAYREQAALTSVLPQVPSPARKSPARKSPASESPASSAKMSSFPISPIFLILVLFMAVSGYMLYNHIGNPGMIIFLFVIIGWLVSLSLHEFGHALIAFLGGDESVADKGYLTLDPLKYTHPVLSILFPIVFLLMGGIPLPGGAVYINTHAIRSRTMVSLTSAAGPIATLLFGLVLASPLVFGWHKATLDQNSAFWSALALLVFFQIFALFLNLIPFPGLDGFGILEPFLPDSILRLAHAIRPFSIIIFFAIFIYSPFGEKLAEEVWRVMMWIDDDAAWLVVNGFDMFRFWQK